MSGMDLLLAGALGVHARGRRNVYLVQGMGLLLAGV